jgi:hypothetical protein
LKLRVVNEHISLMTTPRRETVPYP